MHRALESAIGLPSRSSSASRMLAFVTPPDVRRSFNRLANYHTLPPLRRRSATAALDGVSPPPPERDESLAPKADEVDDAQED